MSGGAYRDRLFRPGDVRRILRRAAELQDTQPNEGAPGGRPQTLEEITRVAEDAGISSVALQRALEGDGERAVAPTGARLTWSWSGAPKRLAIERNVPGPLSPQSHAKLVKVMRKEIGELGNPQAFGDSLSWSTASRPTGGGREIHAIVEPSDHGVLVRIEENLGPLRGGLFGGLLGALGGGGFAVLVPFVAAFSRALIPYTMVAWGLLAYLLTIRLYAHRFRVREAQLNALADTLVAELSTGTRVDAASVRVADEGEAHVSRDESEESPPTSPRAASGRAAPG